MTDQNPLELIKGATAPTVRNSNLQAGTRIFLKCIQPVNRKSLGGKNTVLPVASSGFEDEVSILMKRVNNVIEGDQYVNFNSKINDSWDLYY